MITSDREKLIKLLVNCPVLDVLYGEEWTSAADYLIAHGVVVREDGCEVCRRHVPPGANYCWKCGRPLR